MKRQWLLVVLLILVAPILAPGINYATPNQSFQKISRTQQLTVK
jgi:hypothetical protein